MRVRCYSSLNSLHDLSNMKRLYTFVVLSSLLVLNLLPAESANSQPLKIRTTPQIQSISVQGNVFVPEGTILAGFESKVGMPFNPVLLAKDVQHVYDLGFFSDVQVDAQELDAGIALNFVLTELPAISSIEFEGNDKVKDSKIEEVLTLPPSDLSDTFNLKFYPQKIQQDLENIRQLYHEEGYNNAEISSEILPDPNAPDEKVVLRYTINERQKAQVRGVAFEGNTAFSEKELEENMATREKGFLSFITGTGKYEETTFETDLERLKFFYADKGYLDVSVSDYSLDFRDETSDLFITISLDEGDVYTISDVSVEGNSVYTDEQLRYAIDIMPGDPFSRSNIRKDILAIAALYAPKGYLTPISEKTEGKLLIDPRIDIDKESKQVALVYSIREGVPHYLSRISIRGNEKTRDKVIRRELQIQEGELVNSTLLEKSQRDVFNLGLFDDVNMKLVDGLEPDSVDVTVEVTERSTGSFNFGGGWSSIDNFVLSGGISYANLFGLAHQINFSATLGSVSQTFNLNYTMPRFMDSHYLVGIDAYKTEREYTSYDSSSIGGALRVGRKVIENIFATVRYSYKDVDTYNVEEDASSIIKESEGRSRTSSGYLQLRRTTINNVILPTSGSRTRISGELAGTFLGGDNDFYKLLWDNNTYFPIYKDLAFRFKTEFSYAQPIGDSDEIPIFERFFAGGSDTIRGYEERSVGPKDENGEEIGGNKLAIVSGEFIVPVNKQIRLVAFYDAGDVYGPDENFDISSFKQGVGAGIRLQTPLGLLRLDWGYKLTPEPGESSDELHFGIGALF